MRLLIGLAFTCGAVTLFACDPPTDGLTDGSGCNGCGVVAPAQNTPAAVVADSSGVYWIDKGVATGNGGSGNSGFVGGQIVGVSAQGSLTFLAQQVNPTMIALSQAAVYFDSLSVTTDSSGTQVYTTAIMRVGRDGTNLAAVAATVSGFALLAADDSSVYWVAETPTSNGVTRSPALFKAAADGTNPVMLAPLMQPTAIAMDATSIYVVDSVTLERLNKDGTGLTTLTTLSSLQGVRALAVDDTSLYWLVPASEQQAQGTLVKADKQQGGVTVLASGLPAPVAGLALGGGALYFAAVAQKYDEGAYTTIYSGEILSVPTQGGAPRLHATYTLPSTVASYNSSPWAAGLAVGGSHVYVTTAALQSMDMQGQGDVLSIPE